MHRRSGRSFVRPNIDRICFSSVRLKRWNWQQIILIPNSYWTEDLWNRHSSNWVNVCRDSFRYVTVCLRSPCPSGLCRLCVKGNLRLPELAYHHIQGRHTTYVKPWYLGLESVLTQKSGFSFTYQRCRTFHIEITGIFSVQVFGIFDNCDSTFAILW